MINLAASVLLSKLMALTSNLSTDAYLGLYDHYVYRGVAQRNDGPVGTLGLSLQFSSAQHASSQNNVGWFVDVWGARTDVRDYYYADRYSRRLEWDVSSGFTQAFNLDWRWSLSHAWIQRYHEVLSAGSDYREWRANVYFRDNAAVLVAYSPTYRNSDWSSWTTELSTRWPIYRTSYLLLGLGEARGLGGNDNQYLYGWLGLSYAWQNTQWQMRWHNSGHNADKVLGADRAGSQLELSVSLAWRILP